MKLSPFLLIIFLAFSSTTWGQSELWSGINLEIDAGKTTSFTTKAQFRDDLPISKQDGNTHFYQFQIDQKIAKRWTIGLGYRGTFDRALFDAQRAQLDLQYNSKKKKRTFRYGSRLRLQHRLKSDEVLPDGKSYLRFKPYLSMNASKLVDPIGGAEWFYRLNKRNRFEEFRFFFGANWRVSKKVKLKTTLIHLREGLHNTPTGIWVYSVRLGIKL